MIEFVDGCSASPYLIYRKSIVAKSRINALLISQSLISILSSAHCHLHFPTAFFHPHFVIPILSSEFFHPHFVILIFLSAIRYHPVVSLQSYIQQKPPKPREQTLEYSTSISGAVWRSLCLYWAHLFISLFLQIGRIADLRVQDFQGFRHTEFQALLIVGVPLHVLDNTRRALNKSLHAHKENSNSVVFSVPRSFVARLALAETHFCKLT